MLASSGDTFRFHRDLHLRCGLVAWCLEADHWGWCILLFDQTFHHEPIKTKRLPTLSLRPWTTGAAMISGKVLWVGESG